MEVHYSRFLKSLVATLHGSRQSASLIMMSMMTSQLGNYKR